MDTSLSEMSHHRVVLFFPSLMLMYVDANVPVGIYHHDWINTRSCLSTSRALTDNCSHTVYNSVLEQIFRVTQDKRALHRKRDAPSSGQSTINTVCCYCFILRF